MDVENAVFKCVDEVWRQDAHVPGEADQIDALGAEDRNDLAIVFFTFASAAWDNECFYSALVCDSEAFGVGLVADYESNLCVGYGAVLNRIGERDHVRPAAGDENRDPFSHHSIETVWLPSTTSPIS